MEPITREQLQSMTAKRLVENRKFADQELATIYYQVYMASTTRTSYKHKVTGNNNDKVEFDRVIFMSELMSRLHKTFPGCNIDYMETKSPVDGIILERAILIDWS